MVVYKDKLQNQHSQILAMDTLINLSLRRIATMDSLISDAEEVVYTQYIQLTKQEEKIKRKQLWNRIGFGILTGLLIITTIAK